MAWSGRVVRLRVPGSGVAEAVAWRRPKTTCLHRDGTAAGVSHGGHGEPLGRGTDCQDSCSGCISTSVPERSFVCCYFKWAAAALATERPSGHRRRDVPCGCCCYFLPASHQGWRSSSCEGVRDCCFTDAEV